MRASEEPRRATQLDRIESLILHQNTKLDELTRSQLQPSVVSVRQLLLSSPPALLRGLADCLLLASTGQPAPQLDAHLQAILGAESCVDDSPRTGPRTGPVAPPQGSPKAAGVTFGPFEKRQQQPQLTAEDVSKHLLTAVRKVLEETETVEADTATRLRELTSVLVSELFPSVTAEACDQQLGEQVQDSVAQYLGIAAQDCLENVVYDLGALFQNEISFYRLMNSLNTIPDIDVNR